MQVNKDFRDLFAAWSDVEEVVFQIGVPPNRIDILTSISGVSFSDAWNFQW